jgi:pyrroline-5-carboxylate reductase
MQAIKILFIGGGNMTSALVKGMLNINYPASALYVTDRNSSKRDFFATFGVQVSDIFTGFVPEVDVIILAVKPQNAKEVGHELAKLLHDKQTLILSVMAGITTHSLQALLGEHLAIVRAMPNTPAKIGVGATGLFANARVNDIHKQHVELITKSVGIIAWLEQEEQLLCVNALSGSGPAYYFYFMELMATLSQQMGLPTEVAREFAIQTAYGAAKLALESTDSLAELRGQVTSKGGTTAAAITAMQQGHLDDIFKTALEACCQRAKELATLSHGPSA